MINRILNIARGELGFKEGANNDTKYGVAYGLNYNPWCQMFIWWCANRAGIGEDIILKTASCPTAYRWFKSKGQLISANQAKAGDIIFFNWNGSNNADHVGIVENVQSNIITTIEGNFNDTVARRNINNTNSCIFAVCRPAYVEQGTEEIKTDVITKVKYVNTTAGLNIRAGAGTSYTKIGAVAYKQEVVVLEENCSTANGYSWDKIQYNNIIGYVANKYLTDLSTNTTNTIKYKVNANSGLWLLDGNGKKIKAYAKNTEVEYLGVGYTKYGYNYIKVKVLNDGNVGYMAKKYLI